MNVWPPLCSLPATDAESTFGLICVVLATLLLAGIVLGFWPLRSWLGIDAGRGRPARRITSEASDLCATWRLYRQMGRGDRFSVTDVPSVMVPDSMAEQAQVSPPVPGSTTILTGWISDGHERLVSNDG